MRKITICLVAISVFCSCQYNDAIPTQNYGTQSEPVSLKVNAKLQVGEFLYENIEAPIQVKGYDAANNEKWSNTFSFKGPDANELSVPSGYDHYSISMEKWGVTDNQTLTGKQLVDTRANGPTPVTYVLGGKVPYVKKPVITYEYYGNDTASLKPQSRTEYQYSTAGKLEKMTTYEDLSTDASSQIPTRYTVFSYSSTGVLSKLTEYYLPDNYKAKEDTYEYGVDGSLVKITEANYAANVNATMTLSFDPASGKTKAAYRYSNGIGFDYDFAYTLKNIVSDQTIKESNLCNQGNYSYDRNISPFKHLGYVSFVLTNYSANNKITEKVDYLACSFPSLNPESYEYQYDNSGYPTKKITHYKGTAGVTGTKYYYQLFQQ